MSDFAMMQYAASGMDAQRSALDVLARNVALTQAADRTHPVHPLIPQFAVAGDDDDSGDAMRFSDVLGGADDTASDGTEQDALAGQIVFAGARPAAQAVSGIDAVSEMVSVLDAQRSYEADANVFDAGKTLIQRTLEVEAAS